MQPILTGLSIVFFFSIVIWIFRLAVRANAPKNIRRAVGLSFIVIGVGLIYFRISNLAFLLLFLGSVLALGGIGRSARPSPARHSQVSSAHLKMTLDHDTGDMDGVILSGVCEGRMLSELDLPELVALRASFRDDAESVKLLETYLDHAHADWRGSASEDPDAGWNGAAKSGGITRDEAYRILGLEPGTGEKEIREAYHRLIKRVHPDRGGTAALAAQINEAKDRLLGGR